MVGALILGMGMPTLPAYLIIILVMGPAILALGFSMLTAHMFVLYYAVASSLTPPAAIAAYAAAPIAGSNPLMTALMSFRLGMAKFIIPFIFAFYPTILIVEVFSLLPFMWIVARTCFCIWLFSSALSAFGLRKLTIPEVALRFLAAFALLARQPAIYLPALGVGIALAALGMRGSGEVARQANPLRRDQISFSSSPINTGRTILVATGMGSCVLQTSTPSPRVVRAGIDFTLPIQFACPIAHRS